MLFIFLFLILALAVGGSNYYIAKRLHGGISVYFPKVKFYIIFVVLVVISSVGLSGFFISRIPLPAVFKGFLRGFFAYWLGFFVYLFFFTVIADLVTLILKLCKASILQKKLYKVISVVLVVLTTFSTCIYGICHAMDIKHISYEIVLEGKRDVSDLNIVLISDLHLGAVGSESRLEEIVGEINSLNPDIVCIAGDFFDTDYNSIKNPLKL